MEAKGLMRHGLTLFFAGLITGFLVQLTPNPRAALAGHLEGVMNGTFLLALGCAWSELRLSGAVARWVYRLVLFGAWANWAGTLLSGLLGTSKATPIAGAGHTGTLLQEYLVFAMLAAVGVTMVVSLGIVVWRQWRGPRIAEAAPIPK